MLQATSSKDKQQNKSGRKVGQPHKSAGQEAPITLSGLQGDLVVVA
jgi:hypothetical protein